MEIVVDNQTKKQNDEEIIIDVKENNIEQSKNISPIKFKKVKRIREVKEEEPEEREESFQMEVQKNLKSLIPISFKNKPWLKDKEKNIYETKKGQPLRFNSNRTGFEFITTSEESQDEMMILEQKTKRKKTKSDRKLRSSADMQRKILKSYGKSEEAPESSYANNSYNVLEDQAEDQEIFSSNSSNE